MKSCSAIGGHDQEQFFSVQDRRLNDHAERKMLTDGLEFGGAAEKMKTEEVVQR